MRICRVLLACSLVSLIALTASFNLAHAAPRRIVRSDTVQGIVTDKSGHPAAGAIVILTDDRDATRQTQADANGGFVFFHIPNGHCTIEVEAGASGTLRRSFVFQAGPVAGMNLSLNLADTDVAEHAGSMHMRRTNPLQLMQSASPDKSAPSSAAAAKALSAQQTATNSPADFSIYSNVVAPNPYWFGFNFSPGEPSKTNNHFVAGGGMPPYDARLALTATQNGTSTTFICDDSSTGTDYFASIASGYFVGAQARVYRYANNAWSLVRTGTISGYTAVSGSTNAADHTITFSTSGSATETGDVIWISKDAVSQVPNVSLLDPRFTNYYPIWSTEVGGSSRTSPTPAFSLDSSIPSEDNYNGPAGAPGLSAKIADTHTETQGLWQYVQPMFQGTNDGFETGHTYELSIWLKQTGVTDASMTFTFSGLGLSHTFTGITSTWQKFTWTFNGVPNAPAGASVPSIHFDFNAPGTMWFDNIKIYDTANSGAPDTWDTRVLTALQAFHPGTMRIWSNFSSSGGNYQFWSLDSWLADEEDSRSNPGIGNDFEQSSTLEHLPTALAHAKALYAADPWIVVSMSLSEQEWSNLIDYLCAPAGQGYAAYRPASHPGPYTADFRQIYVEFGNEEWGTQSTPVNNNYGQWLHYMLSQAIAGKSYFDPTKILFVGNGFTQIPSLSSAIAAAAPEVGVIDYYNYASGDTSLTGDAYYQSDLLQLPATNKALIDNIVTQQHADTASGHPYQVAVYEAGPGSDTASHSGDTSLAAGVMTLDTFLYASQSGFGPQNFFSFLSEGENWSSAYTSHSSFATGLLPHPAWEALSMRNRYASGPMVTVKTNAVPVTSDSNAYPLVGVYAFHATSSGSDVADVFVISRDLNNTTPVTLHFPGTPSGTATLYTLTGDPRSGNEAALNIPVASSSLTVTSNYTFNMPPGSVYLFVVPTGAWTATLPPNAPASLTANATTSQVSLTWTSSTGATSYNVKRSTTSGGPYTTLASQTQTSYVDTAVTNGMTYYYVVTAVNSGGESAPSQEVSATPSVRSSSGQLLAYEPFYEPVGPLNGLSAGSGWGAAWDVQGGNTTVPGYNITAASPLSYSGLSSAGNHAIGGYAYLTAGRALNVATSGPFSAYLSNGLIGTSGTSIWLSALVRKDTNDEQQVSVTLHPNSVDWNPNNLGTSVGYFGSSSDTNGTRYWSLEIGTTVYKTSVPVVIGQTTLLVLQITFGSQSQAVLYVNPTSLGGSAPATASVQATTSSSLAFKSLAYYAGDQTGSSSLDEIRIGTTFGAVTP